MHGFPAFYPPFAAGWWGLFLSLFILALVWTIVLKGYSLWYAARAGQKWWFIAILVINTIGILEIVYLIWYRPKSGITEATSAHESSVQA